MCDTLQAQAQVALHNASSCLLVHHVGADHTFQGIITTTHVNCFQNLKEMSRVDIIEFPVLLWWFCVRYAPKVYVVVPVRTYCVAEER